MAENNGEKKANGFISQIEKFLPVIPIAGIFTVLCYFLGRLYTEAYYYALGITPNVLTFDTNDYMFSSFNLVITCLIGASSPYIYLRLFKHEERLFIVSDTKKTQGTKNESKGKCWLRFIFFVILVLFFFPLFIYRAEPNYILITTVCAGFILGFILILFTDFMYLGFFRNLIANIAGIFMLSAISYFLLSSFIIPQLAKIQKESDVNTEFPRVIVEYIDELPAQLQSPSSNLTDSIEGKLVTTNNGMTYVVQSDNSVLALPVDSIKKIIYIKK